MGHPRSVAAQELTGGLQVVPNSTTPITDKDVYVEQIVVSNVSAGTATFTVTDGQSHSLLDAYSLAAGANKQFVFRKAVLMQDGLNWESDTADALHAEIYGTARI